MKLSPFSRIILVAAAALLFASIFMAIWRIELAAPQYPEGLALLIYADKLGGDVEIINGLNHYIGMQTLHTENFPEFKILPYLVGFFSFFALFTAIAGRKKILYILFAAFVCFGIVAMADFYRWNYNYGHNLDPHAAIVVPGMAYQPPLIGYKQLLNFGAFSIPDTGGWLFISAGVFMLLAAFLTYRADKRQKVSASLSAALIGLLVLFASCGTVNPKPVKLNKDNCHFCKMTIVDGRFVAQSISQKGKVYLFDDMSCMIKFTKGNKDIQLQSFFVADYGHSDNYLHADHAFLLKSEEAESPMGGNIVAFAIQKDADEFQKQHKASAILWADLIK